MPNMSTNINTPRQIMPLGTMVYCFYVNVLGIILLSLWLHYIMFINCCHVSSVWGCVYMYVSCKLRMIVITRMSPSCSINNNNRVTKLSETLYLIYKKEQYRSSIYSKMIKYLKTQTLTYLIGGNPLNCYNYHSISLCIFMYTVVINILLIAIKTSGQNINQKLIAVNEMLYFILVYMYMLHII